MELDFTFEYQKQALGESDKSHFELLIKAPALQKEANRKPLNLAIVIDRSGSMAGEKLDFVKKAVITFVKNLAPSDLLSIVTYDNRVNVIRQSSNVKNKKDIFKLVNTITDGNTTNLSGGWETGFKQIREKRSDEYINRILLLTDGLANEGITNSKMLRKLGEQFYQEGVVTTTFGVGEDFDEQLLKQIADQSGGNFYFIANPDQIPQFFTEEIGELLSLVAQNLTLEIEFINGVEIKHIYTDYVKEKETKTSLKLKLDDAYAEDQKAIIFELDFPVVHEVGEYEIAKVKLDYRQLIPEIRDASTEITVKRAVEIAEKIDEQSPNTILLKDIAIFKAAEARRRSYEYTQMDDYATASTILKEASRELEAFEHETTFAGDKESSGKIGAELYTLINDATDLERSEPKSSIDLLYTSRSGFRGKGRYSKKRFQMEEEEEEKDDDADEDSEDKS